MAAILAVSHCYIGWRMQRAAEGISTGRLWRCLSVVLLLSFYLLPVVALVQHIFWNEPDLLAYPQVLVYWFWFGLIVSFQLATWFLILDVILLAFRFAKVVDQGTLNRWYGRVAVALILILFFYTAVKMVRDTTHVQTDTITYDAAGKAQSLQGLRIIHISDLQGDEFTGRPEIAAYIDKVNALEPDLVIFTGDLISYGTDFIDMAAQELSKVQARHGLYAVIGDHDYWAGVPNIEAAFNRYGIPLLQDENKKIPVNNDTLLITGITEVYSRHIPSQDLKQLVQEASSSSFNIIVTHQATEKVVSAAKKANYDMVLGGHTHGGQLRVPFLGMTFSAAEGETPYLSGDYRSDNLFININNGLGFTLAPVRYNAPPSISVIDFQ